ncbi:hypothetical protein D9758_002296 [Tetrapyrgos nigripes]|uniref:Peptidase A1 domain-containing protein n=1 Tax=Tetrapyrgos nigripes TaxID=182062 RepID=A0A8H5LT97_9AGAR|nr:hypothetical protein D9758_002296 [Tetrapyrgos nigripes]
MALKKSFLLLTTLVLAATATPLKSSSDGTAIPLRTRKSLTKQNGVFDLQEAIAQNERTKNKHRQNIVNYHRNELSEVNSTATISSEPDLDKRQSESLTDQQYDTEWTGTISIGTPGQEFLIDFDTGSSDIWVPNSACTSRTCSHKKKYNHMASSTSETADGKFEIHYGDGSTVSGPIYKDTVNVAGIRAEGQYFSAVTSLSRSFENSPDDGVFGLAFRRISNIGRDTFIDNAYAQGAISSKVFSFFLAQQGSELYLGGANSKHYTGAIEYHSIIDSGFWQIPGVSVWNGENNVAGGLSAVIDSGTTIMYGPPEAVRQFYATIPGAKVFDSASGLYSFPCNSTPSLSFSWGGELWTVSPQDFNLGLTAEGASTCVGALGGQNVGLGPGAWLLGDSFMKGVYTVFNAENMAIGFAQLA